MPRPPSERGRQTESHATRAPPRTISIPCQKNCRIMPSRCRRNPAGIWNTDMKNVGSAERTDFTKIRRPPRESSLPHHPPRCDSTFAITGCQSCVRRRRSINGRPRYRMGSVPIGVARISTQRDSSSTASSKPTIMDLARFS